MCFCQTFSSKLAKKKSIKLSAPLQYTETNRCLLCVWMECLHGAKHNKSQPSGLFSIKESCLKGFQTLAAMCSSYDQSWASVPPLSFSQLESHLKRADQGRERERETGDDRRGGDSECSNVVIVCVCLCVCASTSSFIYLSVYKNVETTITLNCLKKK